MTEPVPPVEHSLAPQPVAAGDVQGGFSAQTRPETFSPTAATKVVERVHLPRIAIEFCTQCRWMLRAAYVCHSPTLSYPIIKLLISSYTRY